MHLNIMQYFQLVIQSYSRCGVYLKMKQHQDLGRIIEEGSERGIARQTDRQRQAQEVEIVELLKNSSCIGKEEFPAQCYHHRHHHITRFHIYANTFLLSILYIRLQIKNNLDSLIRLVQSLLIVVVGFLIGVELLKKDKQQHRFIGYV